MASFLIRHGRSAWTRSEPVNEWTYWRAGLLDSVRGEGYDAGALGSLVFHTGKGSFWFGSAGQFPPSNQLNSLLSQNLPELVTGEKIVVALPPGRAPCGAFPGSGA